MCSCQDGWVAIKALGHYDDDDDVDDVDGDVGDDDDDNGDDDDGDHSDNNDFYSAERARLCDCDREGKHVGHRSCED